MGYKDAQNGKRSLEELAERHRKTLEIRSLPSSSPILVSGTVFENRLCLDISEVAYTLGLSQKSVERLVRRGEIKSKRVGRRVLIPRSDIEAWLNQKE